MTNTIVARAGFGQASSDQPLLDTTAYGSGPDDSITDVTEAAAITHHTVTIGGFPIAYTATAGHLVAVDPTSSKPAAKFFYVAFTADGAPPSTRPVTFFYNGGPGSSAVFLLLGSFAPRRIKTSLPGFTPPPPYTIEDNPDSLIDRSDLVYIDPVGTGYSSAIAPFKNRDFWGVDQDALSIKQFIKRYLTAFTRWNSPKFLFGESYGTARSCVLAWLMHKDGIDLNGVTLQSSVLDYTANFSNAPGLMPTYAADAWYHKKTGLVPPPADLPSFMDTVTQFSQGPYAAALAAFPDADPATVQTLSEYLGLPTATLNAWGLNVETSDRLGHSLFLITLLQDQGLALGAYDGRATGIDTGIAAVVLPDGGMSDPTLAAVSGAYTAMWNNYLNTELLFTATSNFVSLNDQAFQFWDFRHTDPAGAVQVPDNQGNPTLYTAGDLAATMSANPDLLVLSANGYYDAVTPFFQTKLTLDAMPLKNARARANLTIRYYPSGHMIYLDGGSRTALKGDLAAMYDASAAGAAARARRVAAFALIARNPIRPYFILGGSGTDIRPSLAGALTWDVADLCAAYSWPRGLAGGGVIAIIELAGGWLQSDIDAYFAKAQLPAADGRRRHGRRGRQRPQSERRSIDQSRQRGGARHSGRRGRLQRRCRRRRIRPGLLGGPNRMGLDGDRHRRRRRRRMRRLLDLLGFGRSELAGGGAGGANGLRRQAQRRRAGGDRGRHDHFHVRRRQRFFRRRTQSGQCRSALVVALRHRLRRHQEAAWRG